MGRKPKHLRDEDTLGKGILYQYAFSSIFALSSAIFYIYIAREFPPYDLGTVTLLFSILALFPLFFSFGLQSGWQHFTSYEIGAGNEDAAIIIIRRSILTGLALSGIADAVLLGTGSYIAHYFFHSYSYKPLIYLLAISIPPSIMLAFFNSIMMGLQNFKKAGSIGIAYTAMIYGITIPFIQLTHQVYAVPIGWGIGYAFGALLFYNDLRRRVNKRPREEIRLSFSAKDLMMYSLPLYLTGILSTGASYIDRLTVALLRDLDLLGIYNLALVISSGVALIVWPMMGVFFSKFSEFHAGKDASIIREGVRISTNVVSLLYVPAALGLAAISMPLLRFLGGSDYGIGSLPMGIMVTIGAIAMFGNPCAIALQGTRRNFIFILSASMALSSNLVFSFLLIPLFSLNGAAVAYASTSAIGPFIAYFYAKKMGLVSFDLRTLSRIWISAITMSVVVYVLELVLSMMSFYLPLYILVGFGVYLLMIRMTSALSKKDKELFGSLVPQSLSVVKRIIFKL